MNERDVIFWTKELEQNCEMIDEITHKLFMNMCRLDIEDGYVLRDQLRLIKIHTMHLSKATKEEKPSRFKKLFQRK